MHQGLSLFVSPAAAAELGRQASYAGSPGLMHLDLVEDNCGEGWLHIRIRPGQNSGIPVARTDGITLYAPAEKIDLLQGLKLNYFGDLSGGGFVISAPLGSESCTCGSGFRMLNDMQNDK